MNVEFWNTRYSQHGYSYGTEPNDFLSSSLHLFPKIGHVLTLGEGEGRNALFLAKQGYDVQAVDMSVAGKEKAAQLASDHGVSFSYNVSDVNDYDFGEDKWDVILSIFAHTDPVTRQNVCQKSLLSLKQGGLFVMEAYHPTQLKYGTGGPKDIEWLVSLDDLNPHFQDQEIIHQLEMERPVNEGPCHVGNAFVTQFICRKISS